MGCDSPMALLVFIHPPSPLTLLELFTLERVCVSVCVCYVLCYILIKIGLPLDIWL